MFYFDNNATTELLPEVREAVLQSLNLGPTNPSSPHIAGEPARKLLAEARDAVANLIGALSEEVFFTSGGTEANNWALQFALSDSRRHLLTTPIEHESVLRKAEMLKSCGVNIEFLPVDCNGIVRLEEAEKMINSKVGMVSVQWVNSETGVIQPIDRLASLCHEKDVLFHTDAAQAIGKLEVNLSSEQIDYLTFTGHKIHAPMGVGVLYRRSGAPLLPILGGGMQEGGQRPGSENLIGIAGLAAAARIRSQRFTATIPALSRMRELFESLIISSCNGACINTGVNVPRVVNTTNIRFTGVNGEVLLARLINAGVCCSQGSACTAQIPEPSHTLLAMGLTREAAYQSIRFSFSELNSEREIEDAVKTIAKEYNFLKRAFSKIMGTRSAG